MGCELLSGAKPMDALAAFSGHLLPLGVGAMAGTLPTFRRLEKMLRETHLANEKPSRVLDVIAQQ